jgi:hypothetical protein
VAGQYADRKRLTFEQAEGAEPLPTQLQFREISDELRAALWHLFYKSFQTALSTGSGIYAVAPFLEHPWDRILYDMHVLRDHKMADEFSARWEDLGPILKGIFSDGDYVTVFGFVQWVLRHPDCPYRLADGVDWALEKSRAAYRVLDKKTIIPIGSAEELKTIERALADVAASEFRGARTHLRSAASALSDGNWPGSVRESIHAVESVARVLDPKSTTLGPALAALEKSIRIHGAMKTAFGSLYGYTSDEKGIRHALLSDGAPQVDQTDAIYMLGSCAAFVSYLINKTREAGVVT